MEVMAIIRVMRDDIAQPIDDLTLRVQTIRVTFKVDGRGKVLACCLFQRSRMRQQLSKILISRTPWLPP